MKTQVSNKKMTLVLAILFAGMSAMLSGQTAEKAITESYSINKGFTLNVENTYGEINVVNWDKNELSVTVTIQTEAGNQDRADKLLDDVNIEIDEGSDYVSFETEIDKKNMNGKNKIKVIYDVKSPSYINVNLEQGYGNVYLQDISGTATLVIKYGNLTANSLVNDNGNKWNMLELKYGNATIEAASGLEAEVKYSGFSVSNVDVLSLESAYSKVNIGEIVDLDVESKYDKIAIDKLNGSLDIEAAYTQVKIGQVSNSFKRILAEMTYGNLKGGLADGTSFNIDAETSYGNINIPEGDYFFEKDGSRQFVEGKVGANSSALVEVSIKYGDLILE